MKEEQFHVGPCESRQICRGLTTACIIFDSKCITRKYLTLNMKIKVKEYNIHNGAIRW